MQQRRPYWSRCKKQLADAERELAELDKQMPTTYVFRELRDPKPAYVLKRGEYDKPGEQVTRAIPAFFGKLPADAPQNRLGVVPSGCSSPPIR